MCRGLFDQTLSVIRFFHIQLWIITAKWPYFIAFKRMSVDLFDSCSAQHQAVCNREIDVQADLFDSWFRSHSHQLKCVTPLQIYSSKRNYLIVSKCEKMKRSPSHIIVQISTVHGRYRLTTKRNHLFTPRELHKCSIKIKIKVRHTI